MNKEHEKIAKRQRQPYTIFSVISSLFILLLNLGGVIAWVDLYLHKGHGWNYNKNMGVAFNDKEMVIFTDKNEYENYIKGGVK